jgi:hypothetical protein
MFTTTDLYQAAFLMARGHAVSVRRLPLDPRRCEFAFPAGAEPDARLFENGHAISAPVFADALKRLKGLVSRAPLSAQPTGAGR